MSFAKGFLIGASTAAHQVEGNNIHSDYWAQELMPHTSFTEPSGIACDHYNRYEEDIKMMAEAGLNAYRFSIAVSEDTQTGDARIQAIRHRHVGKPQIPHINTFFPDDQIMREIGLCI